MENKEKDTCKLLYNTERVRLYIPEYGRNVQKMVDYIKTIEDRQKRNEQARAVITEFCERHGVNAVSLSNEPLFDIGSLFFL